MDNRGNWHLDLLDLPISLVAPSQVECGRQGTSETQEN